MWLLPKEDDTEYAIILGVAFILFHRLVVTYIFLLVVHIL